MTRIALLAILSLFTFNNTAKAEQVELKCGVDGATESRMFLFLIDTVQQTVKDNYKYFDVKYFSPSRIEFRRIYQYPTNKGIYEYSIDRTNLEFTLIRRYECFYKGAGSECETKYTRGKCYKVMSSPLF